MYKYAYGNSNYSIVRNGSRIYCGWNIHHILPKACGGNNAVENLICTNIISNEQAGDKVSYWKKDELDKYLQYKGMALFLNKYDAAPTTFDSATFNFFIKRAVIDEERNIEFEFYDGSRETHFF